VPFFSALALASLLVSFAGCAAENRSGAPAAVSGSEVIVDDFGDTLRLRGIPQRIVSLTPASTELIFALGAGSRLVGRTRWDVWPDSARFVPDLGDGLRPNVEAVIGARPDLVLLYGSLENKSSALRLRAAGVQTLSLKVDLPSEFRELAVIMGRILGDTARAFAVTDSVELAFAEVRALTKDVQRPRAVWIADADPIVVIGGGSFLTVLLEIAGAENVYAEITAPSASVSLESLIERRPDVILGAATLLDRLKQVPALRVVPALAGGRLLVSDSYTMGRPSVRMGDAARTLARLLHPELFR
jgi:iron complex transport system substrate-binding protein